jgi:hypothetical protein
MWVLRGNEPDSWDFGDFTRDVGAGPPRLTIA